MDAIRNLANDAQRTNDDANDEEGDYDFVPNQTTDGYLLFADPKAVTGALNSELGIERPDINTYRLTREDISRLREQAEAEGWHANAAKWAIESAMKSDLGERQRELNEGFGVGLKKGDDGRIVGHTPGQYAAVFGATLPTLEHEELTGEEVAALEDAGVNVDELGFRPDGRPVYPVFTGGKWPVAVENYEQLDAAIEMLAEFPEEPTLGNTDAGEADDGSPEETPEALPLDPAEFTVAELREAVDDYGLDALLEARDAERDGKERKTAIEALDAAIEAAKERLDSVASGDANGPRYDDVEADGGHTDAEVCRAFNRLVDDGVPVSEARAKLGL